MSDPGRYLYCIIRCSDERTFDDVDPVDRGLGSAYTVPHHGLAAVVSDSLAARHESTRTNMLAHQRVQERVMKEYTVLPVRFGTVADAAEPTQAIRRLLAKRFREFDRLLLEMSERTELGIKASWRDQKLVFEEIVSHDEPIRRLRNSLSGKAPEAAHFDRIRLGEMVKGALEQKRQAEAVKLLAPLRRMAHRTVENPVFSDKMILNAAFLVHRNREQEFDAAVNGLESELGHRVLFRYVGPVPPYNFVNITVNWDEL